MSSTMRDVVLVGSESDLWRMVRQHGVRTLTEQAIDRVMDGSLAVAEAYRTCYFGGGPDA
jgi:hypothetical protein